MQKPYVEFRSYRKFVWEVLQILFFSGFLGLFARGLVATIFPALENLPYGLLWLLISAVIFGVWFYRLSKNWIWELRLDDEQLTVRQFPNKLYEIWRLGSGPAGRINGIISVSDDIYLVLKNVPAKEIILLYYWGVRRYSIEQMPPEMRADFEDQQNWLHEKTSVGGEMRYVYRFNIFSKTSGVMLLWIPVIFAVVSVILIVANNFIWMFTGIMFLLSGMFLLAIAKNKSIELDAAGIWHTRFFRKELLPWRNVEAVKYIAQYGILYYFGKKYFRWEAPKNMLEEEWRQFDYVFWTQILQNEVPYALYLPPADESQKNR